MTTDEPPLSLSKYQTKLRQDRRGMQAVLLRMIGSNACLFVCLFLCLFGRLSETGQRPRRDLRTRLQNKSGVFKMEIIMLCSLDWPHGRGFSGKRLRCTYILLPKSNIASQSAPPWFQVTHSLFTGSADVWQWFGLCAATA